MAVLRFKNLCGDRTWDWLGDGLAESLATRVANSPSVQLVERTRLCEVLNELKLQDSALVDPKTAGKLGRVVGAKYVLMGSYQKVGDSLRVDVRKVATETAVATKGVEVLGTFSAIFDLEARLASAVADALDVADSAAGAAVALRTETKQMPAYEWNARGNQRLDARRWDEAIACYDRAIGLDPSYASPYLNRAVACDMKGDLAEAIAGYTRAIELLPGDAEGYYGRGNLYCRTGDYDPGIADLTLAIAIKPGYCSAYLVRALCYDSKGQTKEAMEDASTAIRLNPRDGRAYLARALVRCGVGDYDRCLADLSVSIRLDPLNGDSYSLRSAIWCLRKDYARARQDVELCRSNGGTPPQCVTDTLAKMPAPLRRKRQP